jgi:hypothetical protein
VSDFRLAALAFLANQKHSKLRAVFEWGLENYGWRGAPQTVPRVTAARKVSAVSMTLLPLAPPPIVEQARASRIVATVHLGDARNRFSVQFPYETGNALSSQSKPLLSLALPRGLEPLFSP